MNSLSLIPAIGISGGRADTLIVVRHCPEAEFTTRNPPAGMVFAPAPVMP